MSKIYYDMAKKNYPRNWNLEMVAHFHSIGRLTDEEYADVIGAEPNPEYDPANIAEAREAAESGV